MLLTDGPDRTNIMILLTLIMDIFLLYLIIYQYETLVEFDKAVIYLLLLMSILFYPALFEKDIHTRDNLHVMNGIMIAIVSLCVTNKRLIKLFLFIITIMLIFWCIDGHCPMGSIENTFNGYSIFYENVESLYYLWPVTLIGILISKLFII
jgi:hypothetical protein